MFLRRCKSHGTFGNNSGFGDKKANVAIAK